MWKPPTVDGGQPVNAVPVPEYRGMPFKLILHSPTNNEVYFCRHVVYGTRVTFEYLRGKWDRENFVISQPESFGVGISTLNYTVYHRGGE